MKLMECFFYHKEDYLNCVLSNAKNIAAIEAFVDKVSCAQLHLYSLHAPSLVYLDACTIAHMICISKLREMCAHVLFLHGHLFHCNGKKK